VGEDRRVAFLKMLEELNERHLVGGDGVREVWLIRHADAYSGMAQLDEGPIDTPLSAVGRDQVARLARRLASVSFAAVWSSSLRRAYATAAGLADGRGLEVRTDRRLREVMTSWDQGLSTPAFEPGVYPFPEPESEVAERMRSVVTHIVSELAGADGDRPRAAVVTHNATIAVYLSSVLGLGWGQLRVMPQFTSVSVLAVKGDRVVVQSIGDATHLADA
jgi:broad specificity phosphatase PhoE